MNEFWQSAWTDLRLVLQVVVAALLGGLVGWDREAKSRPAGLRTHMLVGVASALFIVLGRVIIDVVTPPDARWIAFDPSRLLHAVGVGVGFLGAGVIFVNKDQDGVRGLTTAASIWATAGIGAAVGLRRWLLAVISAVAVVAILRLMPRAKSLVDDETVGSGQGVGDAAE